MSQFIFYEKPGCATNSRQKWLLKNAGVEFETRSLLAEKWTLDRLHVFFSDMPVAQWFNRAAPRIKSGEVIPENLSAPQALALMVAEPLLIRRPLLQIGEWHAVGFDWNVIAAQLDIDSQSKAVLEKSVDGVLEGCSHKQADGRAAHSCASYVDATAEPTV
ncbi:MAG: ArsC/Spx/MgsR family protein [Spongiibacteraceae bacterium]